MRVGADPGCLDGYARLGTELDEGLRREARAIAGSAPAPAPAAGAAGAAARAALDALADDVRRLAQLESATTRWVGAVGSALAAADGGALGGGTLALVADIAAAADAPCAPSALASLRALLRSGASPEVVAVVAASLGAAGVWRLAAVAPELVGPVDGMPPDDRYVANRILLRRLVAKEPDRARRIALRRLLRTDPTTGRPRQILFVDPRHGGRVVEVMGRLDSARSVAVLVPGVGNDLTTFDQDVGPRARLLLAAADTAAGGPGRTAVVAWLGYDPPDAPHLGPRSIWELTDRGPALQGGELLARAVTGLDLGPDQRLVLIGHSYGSTTVGAAVLAGARPDAVVAAGSPGMLVEHASQLGASGTEHFTMEAPGDLVTRTRAFGPDPNRPGSGFTRLETGGAGHSAYLRAGSIALANLAAVVAGRPHQLRRRPTNAAEAAAADVHGAGARLVAEAGRAGSWMRGEHLLEPIADDAGDAAVVTAVAAAGTADGAVEITGEVIDDVTGLARFLGGR
ncbi:MAG: hypothetical protein JWM89_823 [Acidimicrobiales bacterium]|nr:hypothetical protein [Acidimicrobiales bacterium]